MTEATSITVRVPLTIRRRPGRKTVVTPQREGGDTALPTRADPALVKALARAFRYQRLLEDGRYASISEMAAAERIDRGYLGRILQLTLFAPDLVETIIDGRHPEGLGLPRLMEPFPVDWGQQIAWLAASTVSPPVGSAMAASGHPAASATAVPVPCSLPPELPQNGQ